MVVLCFNVQGENVFSVLMTSVMCLNLVCKRKIFLSILMASVICVN